MLMTAPMLLIVLIALSLPIAAAPGVVAALATAAWRRRLTWRMLTEALEGTVVTTSMIVLIIIAAYILNMVLSGIGLTSRLNDLVSGLGLSPMQMLLAVVIFCVILGCFMETLSMTITTIPIIAPLMFSLGFDPVWYGIVVMILIETALITPPIGLNLYVVQGVRGRGPMTDVMKGALPFVGAMEAMVAILAAFPGVATWLPAMLMR